MHRYIILFIFLLSLSCKKSDREYTFDNIDFKQEMRNFVIDISSYAKRQSPGFFIIPQNGVQLLSNNADTTGQPEDAYINAIDAQAQEGLFFGYYQDDTPTPVNDTNYLKVFLEMAKNQNKTILVTDYCSSAINIAASIQKNMLMGYVGFVATHRELDIIPNLPVQFVNQNNITDLHQVKNFLYLLNMRNYATKQDFIQAIQNTNYDLLIIDLFFNNGTAFTPAEVNQLKQKANGGTRLVISYISIGEAETYRYYWKQEWNTEKPIWLDRENPNWPGNYKVRYWEQDWKKIIYGNNNSYIKKIINAGFDGAYLDIIDAFEYFDDLYPTR